MDELNSTTQFHFVEKQSDFIIDFLVTDSTLRYELLEKVFTMQATINEIYEKINEIKQLDYNRAKCCVKVVAFLCDDMAVTRLFWKNVLSS